MGVCQKVGMGNRHKMWVKCQILASKTYANGVTNHPIMVVTDMSP